jgi:hypothetical protein
MELGPRLANAISNKAGYGFIFDANFHLGVEL